MSDLVYQNYSNKCRGWSNPFIGPQITNLSGYQSSVSSTSIITINGYNFYPYSRIVFGTLNPTVYFVNSTILRFYIPVNLTYGIYPVQVFNESIGSNIVTYTLNDTTYVLTKSEADALYLSKVNTDTSTAPLTTFNGELIFGSTATFNGALNVGSTATFYSYAPVCGITATSGNQLINKDYVDNTFNTLSNTLNNILNFRSNAFTNVTKSIVYNFNTTTTITKSNVKAKLDNYANIQQVYTFGQNIPNRWVAVGDGTNSIAYSSDGLNWNPVTGSKSLFDTAVSVAWNGQIWVAVGYRLTNKIAYSYDGITWNPSTNGNSIFNFGYGVAWGQDKWIAIGKKQTNVIAYSYDGIIWTGLNGLDIIFNQVEGGRSIAWNGTMWVAGGQGTNTTIAYSYNGINWYESTNGNNIFQDVRSVAFNSKRPNTITFPTNLMVKVGSSIAYSIAYSYNGNLWAGVTGSNSIFSTGNGVAWNGTIWVAVGQGTNNIAYSYNGINDWVGVTGSTSLFLNGGYGVAWNETMWVAVGQVATTGNNTIAYSSNGLNWIPVNNSIFTSTTVSSGGYGVAWNGQMWVAVGGGGVSRGGQHTIAYSSNGIIWNPANNSIFTRYGRGIAWNGIMWVAVGNGGNEPGEPSEGQYTIAYSSDGINWIGITNSYNLLQVGYGVAWNGTMWVAVGTGSNTFVYSYNGTQWYAAANQSTGYWLGISWNGNQWIAVTINSINNAYSSDGINWTLTPNGLINGNGIAWNAGLGSVNIPNGSIVLNQYGSGLSSELDVATDSYYNTGFTNCSISINSTSSK